MKLLATVAALGTVLHVIEQAPQVVDLVKAGVAEVEKDFKDVPGAEKFAKVTAKVNAVLTTLGADAEALAEVAAALPAMINGAVALLKTTVAPASAAAGAKVVN